MTTVQLSLLEQRPIWQPERPIDPDARAVLGALMDGRRWSRPELVLQTGRSDRSVRAAVEVLRREGWPVCSSSDQPGYVLSWRPEDLERLERDLSARALAALKTRAAIRRARKRRAA